MLHQLERRIDKSIDQGWRIIPMESFPNRREGIELLPRSFPTLTENLTAHLFRDEIGSNLLRPF
jgi:hypothetical protein